MVVLRPDFSGRSSQYQIPTNIVSQLRQTSWCASILDDPAFLPLQSHSRTPPPYLVGRYSFMGRTLATAETVPIWQGFYRPSSNLDPDDNDYGEVRVLIVLGSGMDVDYKKPLPTPSVVMIKAKLDPRSRGRKLYITATLEDGAGTILTTAEALFLEVERKPRPKI
jgi:hypothetical protein